MLEILSHQYLKKFVKSKSIEWSHIFSFGRIISKCIKNESTYLINSEIFSTNTWVYAVLISLFLNEENSILVLCNEKIEFLKNNQINDLKTLGFEFFLENDQIIFPNHRIKLVTLEDLLNDFKSSTFKNHRIIFSGIENIKKDLKNYFRISLTKKDWFNNLQQYDPINQNVINTYNFLKKKFFFKRILSKNYLFLDEKDLRFLSNFFSQNSSFSEQFLKVSIALSKGWACWVTLDNTNLEWNFYIEPIDELIQIKELLLNNKFIYLSALRKDNFFQNYLNQQSIDIDLAVNFKSNYREQKILLYVPPKQLLPNNPLFAEVILNKCKKLIIFRNGLTLILCDDLDLKIKLATELASIHGKRILMETLPSVDNQIICASYDWWIANSFLIRTPEQIVVPLLPIPNMSEPINVITVAHNKKHSKDWFKEFLLPEAKVKLERSISPLRRNSGKLIILDGRAIQRRWGRSLLQTIQPSKRIGYMLPFD